MGGTFWISAIFMGHKFSSSAIFMGSNQRILQDLRYIHGICTLGTIFMGFCFKIFSIFIVGLFVILGPKHIYGSKIFELLYLWVCVLEIQYIYGQGSRAPAVLHRQLQDQVCPPPAWTPSHSTEVQIDVYIATRVTSILFLITATILRINMASYLHKKHILEIFREHTLQ